MVVLQSYGALAMFKVFCDHHDTELESRDTEIDVAERILTHKKHKCLYGTIISILYNKDKKCCRKSLYIWR